MQHILASEDYKEQWDAFVHAHALDGGLLQSWAWGDFQKSLDNKIFRLAAVDEDGQFQAVVLLIKQELHFEYAYFYAPRGPVIGDLSGAQFREFLGEIKKIAVPEKVFMIKMDPAWLAGEEEYLLANGYRKSEKEVQPKCCLVLDLEKTEEELMAEMKQKTRYNINLARKHEVKISTSCVIADIESFWQLTKQTAERDGIRTHPKEHYKKMFEVMCPDGITNLFLAEYAGHIIATNMIAVSGNTMTYLHGASADLHREVMAPYLLQWEAILEAKRMGLKYYDFGGVNGKTYFNEKWEGITRFKSGFAQNSEPREYVGCFEQVVNPVVYAAYKFVKQIKG